MPRTEIRGTQILNQTVDMTLDVTNTLPVGNGGTGSSTLALNNVILGNGTGAVQNVAPGTSGNVLTSNGTTWASTAPTGGSPTPAGADTQVQFNNAGALGADAGLTYKVASKLFQINNLGVFSHLSGSVCEAVFSGGSGNIGIRTYGGVAAFHGRSANGTADAPTAITANGQIGGYFAYGYGGTGWIAHAKAAFVSYAAETWTDTATGTYMSFEVTSPTTTNRGHAMRFSMPSGITPANYLEAQGSATGAAVNLLGSGSDANVSVNIVPKGTGRVQANGVNVPTVSSTDPLTNKDLTGAGNTFPTFNQNTTGTAAGITGKTTPTGALVGTTDAQTVTNKNMTSATNAFAVASEVASIASIASDGAFRENEAYVTALAVNATVAAPTGTPTNGNKWMLRIRDNGTARTLAWDAIFAPIGVTLPTSTAAGKYTYVAAKYNSQSLKWDVLAVGTQA